MGVNSLPKTVTRQRHGCDLNLGPPALESSMLTTRLQNHDTMRDDYYYYYLYLCLRRLLYEQRRGITALRFRTVRPSVRTCDRQQTVDISFIAEEDC